MDLSYYKQFEPYFENWHITKVLAEDNNCVTFEIERLNSKDSPDKAALKVIGIPSLPSSVAPNPYGAETKENSQYYRDSTRKIQEELDLLTGLEDYSHIVHYKAYEIHGRSNGIGSDIFILSERLVSLPQYLKVHKLDAKSIIQLGVEICKALEVCERNHVLHRDIKPESIFVTTEGQFKLGNFATARSYGEADDLSVHVGTNDYMAPEMFNNEAYDQTADLYSLGLVLYRLLNNDRLPFFPPYPQSVSFEQRNLALSQRMAGIPLPAPANGDWQITKALQKACASNHSLRYQTAKEMRLDLESLQNKKYEDAGITVSAFGEENTGNDSLTETPREPNNSRGPFGADYTDIRPLAEGGMGTLYIAHRTGLDVDVVIKRIRSQYRGKLDQKSEANVLKLLKHRYLPRIYDFVSGDDGFFYTVMDYIPGVNMQQYITKNGSANQKQAHKWACQLCEVVAYLHEQHPPIIHCDIKPSNLMVTPQGDLCLIDFNTSLVFSDGMLSLGATHGYAAPEQYVKPVKQTAAAGLRQGDDPYDIGGVDADATVSVFGSKRQQNASPQGTVAVRSVDAPNLSKRSFQEAFTERAGEYGGISERTDVYGIGATLYFAVTGKKPEKSLDEVTVISQYHPQISAPFQSIIGRAMEKQPEKRFSNAQEMLRALNDMDGLDRRLHRLKVFQYAAAAVLAAVWLVSIGSTLYGWRMIGNEREGQYQALVTQGEAFDSAGSFSQGREVLQQAIEMSPSRIEAYMALATIIYHEGQYQEAIDTIESALNSGALNIQRADDSALADLYYIEGSCLYELENYSDAIEAYRAAIERSGENIACYRSLAMAYARSGNLAQAQTTLAQLESKGARVTDCDLVRAEIYAMQNDISNALDYYERVYASDADSQLKSHAYLAAAQLCDNNGDPQRSIEILEQAVRDIPEAATLMHRELLATAYSEVAEQNPELADSYYEKAITLWQDLAANETATVVTGMNLAAVQQKMADYLGAEATLVGLMEKYPYDYRVDMRLAFLYADWQGTLNNADRDYSSVQQYYQSANEKYQQAVANGQEDQNMILLGNLVYQLESAGWL